jgi:hypothetical protein
MFLSQLLRVMRAGLCHTPAHDEMHDQGNNRKHQEDMDQSTGDMVNSKTSNPGD